MSLSTMYPALDRRNNLLRSLRKQSASLEQTYDSETVDRSGRYLLPMRARFWPGTENVYGDEWYSLYGDIAIPDELSRPRARPSCLQDEDALNQSLLRKMRGSEESSSGALRGRHSSLNLESAASAAEQSMAHLSRAKGLRASSVSRLQATRDSLERDARTMRASSLSRRAATPAYDDLYGDLEIPEELLRPRRRPVSLQQELDSSQRHSMLDKQQEHQMESSASSRASRYLRSLRATSVQQQQTSSVETTEQTRRSTQARSAARAGSESAEYLGLDTSRVYVPRWLENHPIPDAPAHRRPPPGDVWPEKRPFYDLKNDYDTMLSYMGVTKDLKKAVGYAY